jgi:hypothetical protein
MVQKGRATQRPATTLTQPLDPPPQSPQPQPVSPGAHQAHGPEAKPRGAAGQSR